LKIPIVDIAGAVRKENIPSISYAAIVHHVEKDNLESFHRLYSKSLSSKTYMKFDELSARSLKSLISFSSIDLSASYVAVLDSGEYQTLLTFKDIDKYCMTSSKMVGRELQRIFTHSNFKPDDRLIFGKETSKKNYVYYTVKVVSQ
jgi:hypothetical protein